MDLELSGKTAIVTGGSRGIGKACARGLALEGADVVIAAREPDRLKATAHELAQETGRRIVPVPVDTGNDEAVRSMVRAAAEAFGHLDILVNCAALPGGQTPSSKWHDVTEADFWGDMNVKVMGYLRCAREVAPFMRQRGWGRIINIGGLAARHAGLTVTSMRNVAVVALTKNLADELGPYGINVTAVHPGITRTERTPEVLAEQARRLGITLEQAERRMADSNSVRRVIDAHDIAFIVVFLASPKSLYVRS